MVLRVCHVTTGSDHSTSHQLDICLQERDEVIFVGVLKTKRGFVVTDGDETLEPQLKEPVSV